MALVIKTHQNKTHQNNNKKHRKFFGEGLRPIKFFFGGRGTNIVFYFFLLLKKSFGGNVGDHGPSRASLPPSLGLLK
jgi:hypothetical protein